MHSPGEGGYRFSDLAVDHAGSNAGHHSDALHAELGAEMCLA